jgi:hypothetical protein
MYDQTRVLDSNGTGPYLREGEEGDHPRSAKIRGPIFFRDILYAKILRC